MFLSPFKVEMNTLQSTQNSSTTSSPVGMHELWEIPNSQNSYSIKKTNSVPTTREIPNNYGSRIANIEKQLLQMTQSLNSFTTFYTSELRKMDSRLNDMQNYLGNRHLPARGGSSQHKSKKHTKKKITKKGGSKRRITRRR